MFSVSWSLVRLIVVAQCDLSGAGGVPHLCCEVFEEAVLERAQVQVQVQVQFEGCQ